MIAFDKPTELKTKSMRGGDISLLTGAENTETAQLLKLVKDLAGQVEDMKAVVSQGQDFESQVKYVGSEEEWIALMEQSKEKLVVVDFTASW